MNWIRTILDGFAMAAYFNLHLLQWPLIFCPLVTAVQAGIGVLLMRL